MTLQFLSIITLALERNKVNRCRLRLAMSNLNYDLFRRHLLDEPVCSCRYAVETAEHFLPHCPLYNSIRNKTINKIDANKTKQNKKQNKKATKHFCLETTRYIQELIRIFLLQSTIFCTKLTAYQSVKACLNMFMRQAKKHMLETFPIHFLFS